jgi:regulator of sigma E protease
MLITIFSFLAVIIIVILAHEIGHFTTAKLTGVKVEEFGIFYPPRLFSIKRGETIYSINALPLGGFVKMSGEEDPDAPGSLAAKSIPVRLLVLSAGSLMNLLLPFLLLSIAFMVPHDALVGEVKVLEVSPDSPAELAGIQPEDILLSINGKSIQNTNDLQRYLYLYLGSEIDLLVRHSNSTEEELQLVPRWKPPEGEGPLGTLVTTTSATEIKQSYPFWEAISMGASRCVEILVLFKNGIVGMVTGALPVDLRGPVGIAEMSGEFARAGISPFLEFAAMISINLGIINLFPLPALDGGRIAFVLIELVRRGKRISPRKEWVIHTAGFFLLLAAIMAVTFQDILRIAGGE